MVVFLALPEVDLNVRSTTIFVPSLVFASLLSLTVLFFGSLAASLAIAPVLLEEELFTVSSLYYSVHYEV